MMPGISALTRTSLVTLLETHQDSLEQVQNSLRALHEWVHVLSQRIKLLEEQTRRNTST